jgi:hypothetical protein
MKNRLSIKKQGGFSVVEVILVLLFVCIIGIVGLYVRDRSSHHSTATSGQTTSSTTAHASGSSDCQFKQAIGCHWYIGAPVLAALYKANPSLAKQYFDYPTVFVAFTAGSELTQIPTGWNVTPVYTYFDETKLHSDITSHSLPKGIKGVSLDDELAVCKVYGQNECTPQAEQSSPVSYEQDAAMLAKQNNLTYIDVGAAPDSANGSNRWHAAAFASYVDSQIQLSESSLSKFTQESTSYLAGWRSAAKTYTASRYSNVTGATAQVIDGITAKVPTCPVGQTSCTTYQAATPDEIESAVKATMNSGIWGYWLNCPGGATPGPGPCDQADVSAMVMFLTDMQTVY